MPIIVNGVEITEAAIRAEMQHHPAPSPKISEFSAKLALIAKTLFLQEAARLEITGADEEARITALIEREIGPVKDEASHHRAVSEYLAKLMSRAVLNSDGLFGTEPLVHGQQ